MLNRFKVLFGAENPEKERIGRDEELRLAAAALLVEAAGMDGNFDDDERSRITALLQTRFELSGEETASLIEHAEQALHESGGLYKFTRVIKDSYSPEERIEMIEMLWEVAYADGRVDHFESNLIRRVGGLIYVSDVDRGKAKNRVVARLGIKESSV